MKLRNQNSTVKEGIKCGNELLILMSYNVKTKVWTAKYHGEFVEVKDKYVNDFFKFGSLREKKISFNEV